MTNFDWQKLLTDCVDFTQRLIRTPSMPGDEADIAKLIADEMRLLEFDEVWIDQVGNVSGRIRGKERQLGALVLNSHLDHVDPGDLALWAVPPYGGLVEDGQILGRGACDIKGPLAVQVYSLAALKRQGSTPRRDVVFTAVVEEEVGGAGAIFWTANVDFPVDLIVLGEPSSNQVSLGHRGILQMWVIFPGKSVHASVPQAGINPNFALATFLERLKRMQGELGVHDILGATTVTPTIIEVDTTSMNVTPAWTKVLLDIRTACESPNSLKRFVAKVAGDLPYRCTNAWSIEGDEPIDDSDEPVYGYSTPANDESLLRAVKLIETGMGWKPELINYQFATDGRHFSELGAPIIGYAPGDERLAHTVKECISISAMEEALRGYNTLASSF